MRLLKTGRYPLNDCLTICVEQKFQLGEAYLLSRFGRYEQAMDIYKDRHKRFILSAKQAYDQRSMGDFDKLFYKLITDWNTIKEIINECEKKTDLLCSWVDFTIKMQATSNMRAIQKFTWLKLEICSELFNHFLSDEDGPCAIPRGTMISDNFTGFDQKISILPQYRKNKIPILIEKLRNDDIKLLHDTSLVKLLLKDSSYMKKFT